MICCFLPNFLRMCFFVLSYIFDFLQYFLIFLTEFWEYLFYIILIMIVFLFFRRRETRVCAIITASICFENQFRTCSIKYKTNISISVKYSCSLQVCIFLTKMWQYSEKIKLNNYKFEKISFDREMVKQQNCFTSWSLTC